MRLTRTAVRFVVGVATAFALMLPGAAPAAATPTPTAEVGTPATWTLVDFGPGQEQRICTPPDFARPNLYFFVILEGTWSTPIHFGLSNLPAGSEALTGWPIEPGSGDGHTVLRFAAFHLAASPVGRYTPTLWASDGVVTQTATVIIDVKSSCY